MASDQKGVKQQPKFEDILVHAAHLVGKNTIAQTTERGNTIIFMLKDEADPLRALMAAAVSILTKRGISDNGPVSIRRLQAGLVVPGKEWFWQVEDNEGKVLGNGYEGSQDAANAAVVNFLRSGKT